MRLTLNGKLIGLALGLVAGLLFVFLGWKAFLILLGFILLGFSIGSLVDSRANMKRRLKKLTDRVLRS
ncbi:hypothetical protein KAH43_01860 [Candidatus Bipolaricaulota bacterium]|nr:hypothetical protein [Candidatus Bipolaricaulota bacterium]